MDLYKIRHIPTGLFFKPSKGGSNFSVTGKVYVDKKPSLSWVSDSSRVVIKWKGSSKTQKKLIEHYNLKPKESGYYWIDINVKTPRDEWEIVKL